MDFDQLTDSEIESLIVLPKQVSNPSIRWQKKPGHKQKNYKLEGGEYIFELYLRQNLSHENDFSCGLKIFTPTGEPLILLRYNGSGHIHGDISFACHIHRATHKAIIEGKKSESHADKANNYHKLDEALKCLIKDAVISGIPNVVNSDDESNLFDQGDL